MILGIARDVTDRILAEKAIQASEARYKQIVELAPAGIYDVIVSYHLVFLVQAVLSVIGLVLLMRLHPNPRP